jgi:hypothetical protein
MTGLFQNRLLFRAISISVTLNFLMIVSGTIADFLGPHSKIAIVTGIIATPPGFLFRLLVPQYNSSVGIIAVRAFGALVFSFLFYTAIAWGVMRLWVYLRSSRGVESRQ